MIIPPVLSLLKPLNTATWWRSQNNQQKNNKDPEQAEILRYAMTHNQPFHQCLPSLPFVLRSSCPVEGEQAGSPIFRQGM